MTLIRWMSSAGPFQYGTSKTRTSPPTRSPSCATPVAFVRSVRPMQKRSGRSQKVSPLDRARRLDLAQRRDAGRRRPALEDGGLVGPVRLPRPKRDGAAIGDEQRVEGIDEVRVVGLLVEHVHRRPKAREDVDEGGVLGARDLEIAGVQEAVRGSSNARPKAAPGGFTSTSCSGAVMLWAPYDLALITGEG